jgi:AbrB family looped-hinge helix DNA binding protein
MPPFLEEFYGSVTTNEKGQIVIPADARKALSINPGDKLLVLSGPGKKGLVIIKPETLLEVANQFESSKSMLNELIDKNSK